MYRGGPGLASGSTVSFTPGLRVLVVDDERITRGVMSRMLSRLGCEVAVAENGEIALELLQAIWTPPAADTSPPGVDMTPSTDGDPPSLEQEKYEGPSEGRFAVVFLDNQMPVLSGLDAVRRLREMGRHDFVVGVTGNAQLSGGLLFTLTRSVIYVYEYLS